MRVMVCGGGTGGHAFPAMAVVDELRRRLPDLDVHYLGKPGSIEQRLATESGIPFHSVQSGGLVRQDFAQLVQSLFNMAFGTVQACALMLLKKPQVLFATGGYTSVPPVLAASLFRVPIVIHEQNSIPGRANRLLSRFVKTIATAMPSASSYFPPEKVRFIGNPIRPLLAPKKIDERDVAEARLSFDLSPELKTVFVFGGSQGAQALTQAILDALPLLDAKSVQVLLVPGPGHAEGPARVASKMAVRCEVRPFVEDMAAAYAAADIIVCRGGAITLAEVAAAGKPAIIVPLPTAADDHQRQNAQELVDAGAARLIDQDGLAGPLLAQTLTNTLADSALCESMRRAARGVARPQATEELASLVLDAAGGMSA